jgi:putative hemolysin
VVVANHPYGVLDGIVISWLVEKVRNDFLVLTNAVLLRAPEVQAFVLPVDFSPTEEATQTNLKSRAAARDHLAKGGCVVIFPAGGVSTAPDRLGRMPAVDAPWQPFTAQLVHRGKATVVPICFMGQNSRIFQIASHLSATLRLSLIFREVKNRIGTSMAVAIGAPIPYAGLAAIKDRQALADELRAKTYALQSDPIGLDATKPQRRSGLPGLADRLRALPAHRHKLRQPGWARKLRGQPRPR